MNLQELNRQIRLNTALYLLHKKGKLDRHSLFKMMYFAEQKHLVAYGMPITDQKYIAMEYGPVPSELYNYVKNEDKCFEIKGVDILPTKEVDEDYLSEGAKECLDQAFEEIVGLSFKQRTDKSHGSAYSSTFLNQKISELEIAKEGGAESGILQVIQDTLDIRRQYMD